MKILFVLPSFAKRGGMERVIALLANHYVQNGIEVSIASLFPSTRIYDLDERITIFSPTHSYRKNIFVKIQSIYFLFKILRMFGSDVSVIGFGERFNSITILLCRVIGLPVVVSDRNNPLANNGLINDLLRRVCYPWADGVVAQTIFAQKHYKQLNLNDNICVIGNPISDMKYTSEKQEGQNTIITIGRVDSGKNHSELIDIFKDAKLEGWKLIIIGDGEMKSILQRKVQKMALGDSVQFVGSTDNVEYWLSIGEIFAFTSLQEGLPNALLEAMAWPLACIAYDCPAGPSEIISDGVNGFLIPLGNKELYVKKLTELAINKNLRNSLKSKSILVRRDFAVGTVAHKYLDFIQFP